MINIESVYFSYKDSMTLQEVNLHVKEGDFLAVIGPNGCGKSTLLRHMNGSLRPIKGKVEICGQDIQSYDIKDLARHVATLPQSRRVPEVTVQELVEYGRFPYLSFPHRLKKDDRQEVEEALELSHMTEFRDKMVTELSGGERQRAYIAMLLAQDTPIILMDEPTTYLDPSRQFEMMSLAQNLNQMGKTIVMVLHDLNLALSRCRRIAVMDKGRIVAVGTPSDIIEAGIIRQVFHVDCVEIQRGVYGIKEI